jgi:effector-binding domain-containing protein
VSGAELLGWWTAAFEEIYAVLRNRELEPVGPAGALFAGELFEQEVGDVVAFVPTQLEPPAIGRTRSIVLTAAELAMTVHRGPHTDVDRAYGALGTYVADHALGIEGPVREHYLVGRLDTPDDTHASARAASCSSAWSAC